MIPAALIVLLLGWLNRKSARRTLWKMRKYNDTKEIKTDHKDKYTDNWYKKYKKTNYLTIAAKFFIYKQGMP
ncbi:hypothetical protein F130042H8_15080 [Enterocloster alcoholdehydrogenati]|uniref:Uncharacterized protein n=1 Tax=Enterocloster alcoholdehydrogenati TaxID=2547410 RepID=A0ABQ0AWR0_9FIRM